MLRYDIYHLSPFGEWWSPACNLRHSRQQLLDVGCVDYPTPHLTAKHEDVDAPIILKIPHGVSIAANQYGSVVSAHHNTLVFGCVVDSTLQIGVQRLLTQSIKRLKWGRSRAKVNSIHVHVVTLTFCCELQLGFVIHIHKFLELNCVVDTLGQIQVMILDNP